ncbi:MAG: hypothetical protein WC736_09780 [Gallionella sp.]|jgi:hypothetical protein
MSSIKNAVNKQTAKSHVESKSESVKQAINRTQLRENQRWSFSFRFFEERKDFGLDSALIGKKWVLSVVYRLQELSKLTISQVMESRDVVDGTLRIHNINWDHKNTPIKRADLTSIEPEYLDNPEEFPIIQFAVSKAEGRIIGFFDEDNSFQVVLLDPLHNAQPAKRNEYKVRFCKPLGCEITGLRHEAKKAIEKIQGRSCSCARELTSSLDWSESSTGVALIITSDDDKIFKDADEIISMGKAASYTDIVETGIYTLLDK